MSSLHTPENRFLGRVPIVRQFSTHRPLFPGDPTFTDTDTDTPLPDTIPETPVHHNDDFYRWFVGETDQDHDSSNMSDILDIDDDPVTDKEDDYSESYTEILQRHFNYNRFRFTPCQSSPIVPTPDNAKLPPPHYLPAFDAPAWYQDHPDLQAPEADCLNEVPAARDYNRLTYNQCIQVQTLRRITYFLYYRIAEVLKLPLKTVCRVGTEATPTTPRKRKGRPSLLDTPARKRLIIHATKSAVQHQKRWTQVALELGIKACPRTLIKAFRKEGYSRWIAQKKVFLSPKAREA